MACVRLDDLKPMLWGQGRLPISERLSAYTSVTKKALTADELVQVKNGLIRHEDTPACVLFLDGFLLKRLEGYRHSDERREKIKTMHQKLLDSGLLDVPSATGARSEMEYFAEVLAGREPALTAPSPQAGTCATKSPQATSPSRGSSASSAKAESSKLVWALGAGIVLTMMTLVVLKLRSARAKK